jgi:hypothetical protein
MPCSPGIACRTTVELSPSVTRRVLADARQRYHDHISDFSV